MDTPNLEERYTKLAAEYSKVIQIVLSRKSALEFINLFFGFQLRAQAGVLKRAVLEEQNKNSSLRDAVRDNETNLRRAEQEIDSLGFRNKQLEHRVASLQDDLNKDASKKMGKNTKSKDKTSNANSSHVSIEPSSQVLSEEFQKKIFECAQLTSAMSDKDTEIQLQANRIAELENLLRSMNDEQTDTEAKLRKEVERLTVKVHDMEAKLAEATSIVGSDDTLYVSELEQHKPINSSSNNKLDERIVALEKDVLHWRTQCELLQMKNKVDSCKAISVDQNKIDNDTNAENEKTITLTASEQILIDNYSKKVQDLLRENSMTESKLAIYVEEVGCILFSIFIK